jgi:hypothetical protein
MFESCRVRQSWKPIDGWFFDGWVEAKSSPGGERIQSSSRASRCFRIGLQHPGNSLDGGLNARVRVVSESLERLQRDQVVALVLQHFDQLWDRFVVGRSEKLGRMDGAACSNKGFDGLLPHVEVRVAQQTSQSTFDRVEAKVHPSSRAARLRGPSQCAANSPHQVAVTVWKASRADAGEFLAWLRHLRPPDQLLHSPDGDDILRRNASRHHDLRAGWILERKATATSSKRAGESSSRRRGDWKAWWFDRYPGSKGLAR